MSSVQYYWSSVSGKCYRWEHPQDCYGLGTEEKVFLDPPDFIFDVGGGMANLISFTTDWHQTRRNIETDMVIHGLINSTVYIFDPDVNPYWHSGYSIIITSEMKRHCSSEHDKYSRR